MNHYPDLDPKNLHVIDMSKAKCQRCKKPMSPEPMWLLGSDGKVMCEQCFDEITKEPQ